MTTTLYRPPAPVLRPWRVRVMHTRRDVTVTVDAYTGEDALTLAMASDPRALGAYLEG